MLSLSKKCRWAFTHKTSVILLQHFFFLLFLKALQDARIKTTDTLVAMEEEDDFDDPLTPTPVKGQ